MIELWMYSIVSVLVVSLISLLGALVLLLKRKSIKQILILFVSFAAGAMLGDVFLHLLPELAHENLFNLKSSALILAGILIFFILEKIIHWRHCHMTACEGHVHPLAYMNLIGDAVHNFLDGVLIAGSYFLSVPVGIATTIAVVLHEIPQEMGDFGVMLHSGMKPKKALLFNFFSATTAILGAVLVLVLGANLDITPYVVPITIGGFLYIANADLIPELHKETRISQSLLQLLGFSLGVLIMYALLFLPLGDH